MDKQQEAAAAAAGTPSEDSISMKTEYPAHEVFVSEPLPVSVSKSEIRARVCSKRLGWPFFFESKAEEYRNIAVRNVLFKSVNIKRVISSYSNQTIALH